MGKMLTSHIVSRELAAVDPREPISGMLRDRGLRLREEEGRRVVCERVCRSVIKRGVPVVVVVVGVAD
jgi:hypothetical protein